MDADEHGSAKRSGLRFGLKTLLGLLTLVAITAAWSLSWSRLSTENRELRRQLTAQEQRLADIEDLLTGRPFEYRTSGLAVTSSGGVFPERLAPMEQATGIPEGVDEAMLMDGAGMGPQDTMKR